MQLSLFLNFQKHFILRFPEGGLRGALVLLIIAAGFASYLDLNLLFRLCYRLLCHKLLRLRNQMTVLALVQHELLCLGITLQISNCI